MWMFLFDAVASGHTFFMLEDRINLLVFLPCAKGHEALRRQCPPERLKKKNED